MVKSLWPWMSLKFETKLYEVPNAPNNVTSLWWHKYPSLSDDRINICHKEIRWFVFSQTGRMYYTNSKALMLRIFNGIPVLKIHICGITPNAEFLPDYYPDDLYDILQGKIFQDFLTKIVVDVVDLYALYKNTNKT